MFKVVAMIFQQIMTEREKGRIMAMRKTVLKLMKQNCR
jgi:hypothetical protein